jgi:hypothetical protein
LEENIFEYYQQLIELTRGRGSNESSKQFFWNNLSKKEGEITFKVEVIVLRLFLILRKNKFLLLFTPVKRSEFIL